MNYTPEQLRGLATMWLENGFRQAPVKVAETYRAHADALEQLARLRHQAGAVAFNLGRARGATTSAEKDHWVMEAMRCCEGA